MALKSIILCLAITNAVFAMEQKDLGLSAILIEAPTLRFISAWQASKHDILPGKLPAEVLEFVNRIKVIKQCADCTIEEKKFFLNLLNNPNISDSKIKEKFPNLVSKYLKKQVFTGKKQLLNEMLLNACQKNMPDIVQLSIDEGADVNAIDKYGESALMRAIKQPDETGRNEKVIAILLDNGADVNFRTKDGFTALIFVEHQNRKIIQMLVDKGANVNAQAKNGWTALMGAATEETLRALIDNGADLNAQDEFGNTALMHIGLGFNEKLIQILIAHGANLNIRNKLGETALIWAAKRAKEEVVKTLLQAGPDVNIKNNKGQTALTIAEKKGDKEIIKMLKEAGATE